MDRNTNYFYLSGLLSFGMFFLFVTMFLLMMLKSQKIKTFALTKDTFISVSIDLPKPKPKKQNRSKVTKKIKKKKKVVEKKKKQLIDPIESQDVDINDLFSELHTKEAKIVKHKVKKIDKARLQQIAKKIDTTKENSVQKIEPLQEDTQTRSSATEINEYLAKIQLKVYESFFPPPNSQGHSVKAVIELDALGKVLDFRILTYSSSTALNEECDKIKERLLGVNFPLNPEHKSGRYTVILKAQGKE